MDVDVRQAELSVRTCKLTRSLLKQLRKLNSLPQIWLDENGKIKPEYVVGWIHGSVLGDEFTTYTLLKNGRGDYFLFSYVSEDVKKYAKQIYIG